MIQLRSILVAILIAAQTVAVGQDTRTIDGRKYVVHIVEVGQTLYAISRSYAVPVDALVAANPGSVDGLRIGQELLIPKDAVMRKEARMAPTLESGGELRHTVARKETVFGIARKYGVDVNDLLARNPGIQTGLQEGTELIIPTTKVIGVSEPALRPANGSIAIDHRVQQGETLYSLGLRYRVKPEEILDANGGLPSGLQAGSTIRIPKPLEVSRTDTTMVGTAPVREKYHVAFLLPFAVGRNDSTLESTALAEGGPRFYEPTRIAAQFYAGAQLALDSLVELGFNADVDVMDVGDDQSQWGPVLKSDALNDVDLFIGPFHRTAIEQLTRAHPKAQVICPVPQTSKVILGQPQVSKVAPVRSDLLKHGCRYVANRFARENILLLQPDIQTEKEMQGQALSAINGSLALQSLRYRDSVLVVRTGRRDIGDLAARLETGRTNVVVVPSEDVEYVTTVVNRLKPLAAKQAIVLVGMEAWLDMQTVAAQDLDLLNFHFAAASFIDPTASKLIRFTRAFRERFHTDIDEYALLGFDVTFHFLHELMENGPNDTEEAQRPVPELLHMGFRMSRTGPENGSRNDYAVMLRQKDLKLEKAP